MNLPKNPFHLIRGQRTQLAPTSPSEELRNILGALRHYKTSDPVKVEDAIRWVEVMGDREVRRRLIAIAERLTYVVAIAAPIAVALLALDGHLGVALPSALKMFLKVTGFGGLSVAGSVGAWIAGREIKLRRDRKRADRRPQI